MNDKLMLATKAHRIGVEDAKFAFKFIILTQMRGTNEEKAEILKAVENMFVLPSRLVKEVFDAEVER
jgi:hypothetical protein